MNSLQGALPFVALMAFSSMALTRLCDPMLTTLGREFDVSLGEASRVISWYAVAYGACQLLWGPLGDKLGKLKVVLGTGLACAVLSLGVAFTDHFDVLVALRVAMGAMAAAIIPLSMAWIGDRVDYQHRQQTLAQLMAATVTGMMAGQWLGGLAADHFGWRWAFAGSSLVFLASSLLLLQRTRHLLREPSAAGHQISLVQHFHRSALLFRVARVRWVLLIVTLEGALVLGPLAFVPSILIRELGLSVTSAGALMMLYGVGGLAYTLIARRWLQMLGEKGLALCGALLIAVSLMLFGWSASVALSVGACFAGGLGFYMLHNTLQTQATQMAPEARGAAVALFAGFLFAGQSVGVSGVAQFVDGASVHWVFSACAAGIVVLGWRVSKRVGLNHPMSQN